MSYQMLVRIAFLLGVTTAGGQATTIGYSGVDPLRSFDIWFTAEYRLDDQLLPAQGGGTSSTTQLIDVNLRAGIANLLVDGLAIDAVCADFFTLISNGNYSVNVLGAAAVSNGTRLAWMLRNTLPTINSQQNTVVKQQLGAGFQLAVWDIIHDGGDGFAAGRIRANVQTDFFVLAFANQFLSNSAGQSQADAYVYQNVAGLRTSQTLISDVPEPSTWLLMGSAVAALGLFRRRAA